MLRISVLIINTLELFVTIVIQLPRLALTAHVKYQADIALSIQRQCLYNELYQPSQR